jgi:hypothetical protein
MSAVTYHCQDPRPITPKEVSSERDQTVTLRTIQESASLEH